MDDVDDTVDVGVAAMYSRAGYPALPMVLMQHSGQVRRAHEIRNTMDKVREADQVKRTAGNTNEMAHT
jgi:hypothetical protein